MARAKNQERNRQPSKPKNDIIYCVYHEKDLDGIMSAAIVCSEYENVKLIPYDYGKRFPMICIKPGSLVFMLDICLPEKKMRLLDSVCDLYLIDHHPKTINNAFCKTLKGSLRYGLAACVLTWVFFHPYAKIPEGIKLLGYYDVWDQSDMKLWEERTLPFQFGCRQFPNDPKSNIYGQIIESNKEVIDEIVYEGGVILRYEKKQAAFMMEKYSYEKTLLVDNIPYNVLVINRQLVGSDFFMSKLNKKKHAFCIAYQECDGVYNYSLRSWKGGVEVNKVAKFFDENGGGHKYAAGFTLNKNILTE